MMVQIYRKEGWELNPNDKVVNAILKRIEICEGKCPCSNNSEDTHCPCTDYRNNDVCHCGLYTKKISYNSNCELNSSLTYSENIEGD